MSNVEVIVSEGINSPEGLALDWLAKRLYWVDDMSNTVEVVNTDGSDRRVLKDGLDRPRDIVVDPFQKYAIDQLWFMLCGLCLCVHGVSVCTYAHTNHTPMCILARLCEMCTHCLSASVHFTSLL